MGVCSYYLLACASGNDEACEYLGVLTEHFLTYSDDIHWFLWAFCGLLCLIAGLLVALILSEGWNK